MKKLVNKVGILKATIGARSIPIEKNPADLESLMFQWSTETLTFVTTWEKFCPSLENVAMLMSLPLFGEAHATQVNLKGEDQMKVDYLAKSLLEL